MTGLSCADDVKCSNVLTERPTRKQLTWEAVLQDCPPVSCYKVMSRCRKCFVKKRGWLVIKKEMRGRFASPEMHQAGQKPRSHHLSGVACPWDPAPLVASPSSFLGEKYVCSCETVVEFYTTSVAQYTWSCTVAKLFSGTVAERYISQKRHQRCM